MMKYSEALQSYMDEYNSLKAQYDEMVQSSKYQEAVGTLPFELLSAKQVCETMSLFANLDTKPKILFSSVEEAEVLYSNIRDFKKKLDELLDAASYITEVDTLTDKINHLIDNAPYLPRNLKLCNNKYLAQIAADCLQELPKYPKLASYEFLYNFVESCLYSFNKEQLQTLVSKQIIKDNTIDKIALNGTEKYEENLQYLCFLTGHKEIITDSFLLKLKGVKFKNDDGTERQEILKEMKQAVLKGENINLRVEKYVYQPDIGKAEPAVRVLWNDKCIGLLPAPVAAEIEEKHENSQLKAEFQSIGGGGDVLYGCEIKLNLVAPKLAKDYSTEEMEK